MKCWRGALLPLRRGGSGAHRSYGSTVAKLVQPMESKTPGSARKVQESDERWPALTNAQNLSYTLKVNEVGYKVWSTWELSTSANHLLPVDDWICCTSPQQAVSAALAMRSRSKKHLTSTGFVRPDNFDAKFLAALSGVGGLDALGKRFVGNAGQRDRRDVENPFRLTTSDEIARQHCTRHGVMKLHESGAALAQDMGVPVSKIEDSIEAQASLKTDTDGGGYPASPNGKSRDEASQERSCTIRSFREPISQHSPLSSLQ